METEEENDAEVAKVHVERKYFDVRSPGVLHDRCLLFFAAVSLAAALSLNKRFKNGMLSHMK